MPRTKPTGIPASLVLAVGTSRHGSACGCAYCAPDVVDIHQRQAIPVIHGAGVLQPVIPINPPPTRNAIDEAFTATRETIADLVAERDAREIVGLDIVWSPAQVCRSAA